MQIPLTRTESQSFRESVAIVAEIDTTAFFLRITGE